MSFKLEINLSAGVHSSLKLPRPRFFLPAHNKRARQLRYAKPDAEVATTKVLRTPRLRYATTKVRHD